MIAEIQEKLLQIERENRVRILYACESGSRAWGFPSTDSDFDVRFIYIQEKDRYFDIDEHRDTIDIPVNEILDINGWDIRKALKLFRNSNAPLYEWLQSPIVYKQDENFTDRVKAIMPDYFSLRAGMHHYVSMARNAFNDLQGEEVKMKKYFYSLRPLLAAIWIADKAEIPPMEFSILRTMINDEAWNAAIDILLEKKASANEKSLIAPMHVLQIFIQERIEYCLAKGKELQNNDVYTERLNSLFRNLLNED